MELRTQCLRRIDNCTTLAEATRQRHSSRNEDWRKIAISLLDSRKTKRPRLKESWDVVSSSPPPKPTQLQAYASTQGRGMALKWGSAECLGRGQNIALHPCKDRSKVIAKGDPSLRLENGSPRDDAIDIENSPQLFSQSSGQVCGGALCGQNTYSSNSMW
jgi:hypothetical protein